MFYLFNKQDFQFQQSGPSRIAERVMKPRFNPDNDVETPGWSPVKGRQQHEPSKYLQDEKKPHIFLARSRNMVR